MAHALVSRFASGELDVTAILPTLERGLPQCPSTASRTAADARCSPIVVVTIHGTVHSDDVLNTAMTEWIDSVPRGAHILIIGHMNTSAWHGCGMHNAAQPLAAVATAACSTNLGFHNQR